MARSSLFEAVAQAASWWVPASQSKPQLFASAVAEVPFVDVVSTMSDPSLPLTVTEWEEWGDPRSEPYASYIDSYSPYDNTRPANYPALLITAGLNDPRVSVHEPAKWTARLREVRTNVLLCCSRPRWVQAMAGRAVLAAWEDEAALWYSPRDRHRNDVTHTNAALAASAINTELRATCRQPIGFFDDGKAGACWHIVFADGNKHPSENAMRSPPSTRGMTGAHNRTAVRAPMMTSRSGSG